MTVEASNKWLQMAAEANTNKYKRASFVETKKERLERLDVSPDMAKQLLDGMVENRDQRQRHIENLAEAIKNGQWVLGASVITLDENGRVIDGQHRLQAIILANMIVPVLFLRNVSSYAFEVFDTGQKRNLSDHLKLRHFKNVCIVACCAEVCLCERMGNGMSVGNYIFSMWQSIEFAEKNRAHFEKVAHKHTQVRRFLSIREFIWAFNLLWRKFSLDDVFMFFDTLASGGNQVCVVLREMLLQSKASERKRDKLTSKEIIALTCLTGVKTIKGQQAKTLNLKTALNAYSELLAFPATALKETLVPTDENVGVRVRERFKKTGTISEFDDLDSEQIVVQDGSVLNKIL